MASAQSFARTQAAVLDGLEAIACWPLDAASTEAIRVGGSVRAAVEEHEATGLASSTPEEAHPLLVSLRVLPEEALGGLCGASEVTTGTRRVTPAEDRDAAAGSVCGNCFEHRRRSG